jgi:hypothetical protein
VVGLPAHRAVILLNARLLGGHGCSSLCVVE